MESGDEQSQISFCLWTVRARKRYECRFARRQCASTTRGDLMKIPCAYVSSPHCEMSGFFITIEKLGHLAPSAKRKFVSSFAESGWHGKHSVAVPQSSAAALAGRAPILPQAIFAEERMGCSEAALLRCVSHDSPNLR